jgi:hypothetical protein
MELTGINMRGEVSPKSIKNIKKNIKKILYNNTE